MTAREFLNWPTKVPNHRLGYRRCDSDESFLSRRGNYLLLADPENVQFWTQEDKIFGDGVAVLGELTLGQNVLINDFTVLAGQNKVGTETTISGYCMIGRYTEIGSNCQIPPGTVIPSYVTIPSWARQVISLGRGRRDYPITLVRCVYPDDYATHPFSPRLLAEEHATIYKAHYGHRTQWRIIAGCKDFNLLQAERHWGPDYRGYRRSGDFMLKVIARAHEMIEEQVNEFSTGEVYYSPSAQRAAAAKFLSDLQDSNV